MAKRDDYITRLKEVPLFSTLSKKDVARIATAADEVDFPAGHVLITEGQQGSEAYVLLSGTASISRQGTTIAALGAGEIIGELALLEDAGRAASVTCETDCSMLVLDRRHFIPLLEETPALAIKFLEELARRLRELDRTAFG
jgi:CRP/FNR family cyclic AMP-dependent transcriptional regulator